MNRWIRRGVIAIGAVALLAGALVAVGSAMSGRRMERHVDVTVAAVPVRDDAATLERGRYLFSSRGCAECHSPDGHGTTVIDEGGMLVKSPNISPGPGSVVAAYKVEDWVRTIRHGVKRDGRPVMIMPSEDYNRLTDDDVGAIIAYARHLAPAAGGAAVVQLPLPVQVLYGYGLIPDAAARIDHQLAPSQPVPEGVTPEHGRYVAQMCQGCHGPALSGGPIPGGPPDWPPAANLTPGPGGVLARYPDAASLAAMFRSGHRPDGSAVKVMPFPTLRVINDVDVGALHLYLKTLPPHATGA